jgi:hypothetical protein
LGENKTVSKKREGSLRPHTTHPPFHHGQKRKENKEGKETRRKSKDTKSNAISE